MAMFIMLLDFSGNGTGHLTRGWAWFILKISGVKIEIEGLEKLESGKSYAFISNHASLLDIPAVLYALPVQLRFLVKKELFKIPIFGQAMLMAGHIRINRQKLESAIASLKAASVRLKKRGWSVLVFAEGTRSLTGEVGKFKKGGILLAISMKIPIIPLSISGSRKLAPKGDAMIKSGMIKIVIGEPIITEGINISDRNALLKRTRDEVLKNMDREDAYL